MKIISIFYILIIVIPGAFAQEISIIPIPSKLHTASQGAITVGPKSIIKYDPGAKGSAAYLANYCHEFYHIKLILDSIHGSKNEASQIHLEIDKNLVPGQYFLDVSTEGIRIRGSEDGVFYGIQSLIQIMPVDGNRTTIQIPFVAIEDQPRFPYRGLLLDVSRHFFSLEFLKKCIDYAAAYKINYFHLHLTDDQGWRVEIKKYPMLTQTGSWRNGTMIGLWPGTGNDSIRHGGFYTQQELKDLVKYAVERYVTIIPEIEMPGHSLAALASYKFLGCTGGPYQVKESWGASEDVFCAGKESTFEFLLDVLDEIIEIFPSQYIHIGGDECQKTRWKQCTDCQARIKAEGLRDEQELQNYFITRIGKYLGSKNRTLIGWDEILEGDTPAGAVIMSWRGNGETGCIDAIHTRHSVILSPSYGFYLDYPQTSREDSLAAAWGGVTTLRSTYEYEPVNDSIKPEEASLILGGQTAIWTEYINNVSKAEYMAFPRLTAVSEVLWSPADKRDWSGFKNRLELQYKRFQMWGIKYNPADPDSE